MKKIYFLALLFLTSALSFGQSPVIITIMDATCFGGQPKAIEIYADGNVDFTNYSLVRRVDSNAWDNALGISLASLNTRVDEFVYLLGPGDTADFQTEFPAIPAGSIIELPNITGNGNDSFRIIDAGDITIDEFGAAIDGTGETWEYTDSYAQRINGTGPDNTFVEANWTYAGPDVLDGDIGSCNAGPLLSTIINLGNYVLSATPQDDIEDFRLYPNPITNGTVSITTAKNLTKQVAVFDVLGKQVLNRTLVGTVLDVSALNSGIYILKVTEDKKTTVQKLVIK